MPITYNREISTTLGAADTVTYTASNNGAATQNQMLAAEGDYAQPTLYLKMGFGSLTVENDLGLRLYGIPAYKLDGKAGSLPGVGYVTTVVNKNTDKNVRTAVWDSRFWLEDVITPSYNFSSENGKLAYSASAILPVTVGLSTHAMNILREDDVNPANDIDLKKFYTGSDLKLGVDAKINAGVKLQVLELLSVQGGIGLDLFSWQMIAASTKKVDLDAADQAKLTGFNTGLLVPHYVSGDTSVTNYNFGYANVDVAAGFTFNFKDKAALDMLFIYYTNPTLGGAIYRAVGDGIGKSEASVVLTLKF